MDNHPNSPGSRRRQRPAIAWIAAAVMAISSGLSTVAEAHHSAADIDGSHELTVTGTVRSFKFRSPHGLLTLLVRDRDTTAAYLFETAGPPTLVSAGIHPQSFRAGDRVTIGFYPWKYGRIGGEFAWATLADGQHVRIGTQSLWKILGK